MLSYVYGIRVGDYVKIGFAKDPKKRIDQLRWRAKGTIYPDDLGDGELEVLFVLNADQLMERVLHAAFAEQRAVGEWFKRTGPVLGMCETLSGRQPSSLVLALSQPVGDGPRPAIAF